MSSKNPAEQLLLALQKAPQRVQMVPMEELLLDSGRANAKRPAYLQIAVEDEVVKSLRGSPDKRDLLLFVRVPRAALERAESPIILPGEL